MGECTSVQRADNGLGQLITEYQSHSGAANVNSTPKMQHAYTETSGGPNYSRPTSMTYPDGGDVNDNYRSGVNDTIKKSSGTDYRLLSLGRDI